MASFFDRKRFFSTQLSIHNIARTSSLLIIYEHYYLLSKLMTYTYTYTYHIAYIVSFFKLNRQLSRNFVGGIYIYDGSSSYLKTNRLALIIIVYMYILTARIIEILLLYHNRNNIVIVYIVILRYHDLFHFNTIRVNAVLMKNKIQKCLKTRIFITSNILYYK